MQVLVFLPTYNECDNLGQLVSDLFALPVSLHILVVDDQSPDGTGQIADGLALQYPGKITVIHRTPPRGRGLAGIEGLQWASQHQQYEVVIEMDADLSHPARFIPEFLEALNAAPPADLVIGSRHLPGSLVEGWPRWRYLNSAVANWLARCYLGLPKGDITSGFRCFRNSSLALLPWEKMITTGPAVVEEILYYCQQNQMKVREIPITFIDRVAGQSKVSPKLILRWIREISQIGKQK